MSKFPRRAFLTGAAAAGAAALGVPAAGQGPQPGKPGPRHNTGPVVPSKANASDYGPRELFAVVDANGALRRGMHVAGVAHLAPGLYEVTFRRDVRCGVYVATVGGHTHEGLPPAGSASVQGRSTNPRGVLVSTINMLGENVDLGFHLLVVCPDGFA
jgi:hypothetical protein